MSERDLIDMRQRVCYALLTLVGVGNQFGSDTRAPRSIDNVVEEEHGVQNLSNRELPVGARQPR